MISCVSFKSSRLVAALQTVQKSSWLNIEAVQMKWMLVNFLKFSRFKKFPLGCSSSNSSEIYLIKAVQVKWMFKEFPLIQNILNYHTRHIWRREKYLVLIMALVIRYYGMLEIRALNLSVIYEETFFGPHVGLPCVDGSWRFFWPIMQYRTAIFLFYWLKVRYVTFYLALNGNIMHLL